MRRPDPRRPPPREFVLMFSGSGQFMGLELMIDLNAMLGSTEKQVCLTQFVHRLFVQKSCLTEQAQGFQGTGRPHSWRFPAVNKLKRLNKEFDLPDSTLAH